MKKFIASIQNLSVVELDYYQGMSIVFDGNRDSQREFEKLRNQNKMTPNLKGMTFDEKRQQFISIDVMKLVQPYQGGT